MKGSKTHDSQLLDQKSTLKRHTVSQMSKMHQRLKTKKRFPYEQAEIVLDIQRQRKKETGLSDKLVEAGFIERD